MTKQERYDAAQTEKLNRIRLHLQSLATLAVQAQDEVGNLDVFADTLDLIEHDLTKLRKLNEAIQRDDVFANID